MTITAQDILTKLGYSAWSGFNIDDMVFDSDDSAQAREELNRALRFLINLEDFPFKKSSKTITTKNTLNKYSLPSGQIIDIYNSITNKKLNFIGSPDGKNLSEKGCPNSYWIETKGTSEKLCLYPIPDDTYTFNIIYNQFMPVLQQDGNLSFEFTSADDCINIPSRLEYLFVDCLILRTIAQNNKDDQDENYQPTLNEFWEHWRLFKNAAKTVSKVSSIVW